jgi:hypothetical protein
MQPIEFMGLAQLLGARVMREKDPDAQDPKDRYEPLSFADVLEDVCARFEKLNRKKKREILKLVKKTTSER